MSARVAATFALAACLAACPARADDDDPEPAGASLRRLWGKWAADRAIYKGQEKKVQAACYVFGKDKAVYTYAEGKPQTMALKAGKGRAALFELTPEKGKATRWFYKIEMGELHLVPDWCVDREGRPDFSSEKTGVLILKREKK